jgi:hypothetical protein
LVCNSRGAVVGTSAYADNLLLKDCHRSSHRCDCPTSCAPDRILQWHLGWRLPVLDNYPHHTLALRHLLRPIHRALEV